MSQAEVETLRRWARGDFYPLSQDERDRDALDELADEMARQPFVWWEALHVLLPELDEKATRNLDMPFAAVLDAGGDRLVDDVANVAQREPRVANAFWHAMHHLRREIEAYRRLGRQQTIEAFIRHEPRIPTLRNQPRMEVWEDDWSGDALFDLTEKDPDEAWAVALELLAVSADPGWISTIGAFIIEDILRDHGDEFIERIETEAAANERLRRALPVARWVVPEHLMARVKAAAGKDWDAKT